MRKYTKKRLPLKKMKTNRKQKVGSKKKSYQIKKMSKKRIGSSGSLKNKIQKGGVVTFNKKLKTIFNQVTDDFKIHLLYAITCMIKKINESKKELETKKSKKDNVKHRKFVNYDLSYYKYFNSEHGYIISSIQDVVNNCPRDNTGVVVTQVQVSNVDENIMYLLITILIYFLKKESRILEKCKESRILEKCKEKCKENININFTLVNSLIKKLNEIKIKDFDTEAIGLYNATSYDYNKKIHPLREKLQKKYGENLDNLFTITLRRDQNKSGMQRSGMQRSGMQRSGMQRSGMQRSGMQRSGMQRSGMQRSGMQRSGMQRSVMQRSVMPSAMGSDQLGTIYEENNE